MGILKLKNVGESLREICKSEKMFKIMTGYRSLSSLSKCKNAALKSLSKMKNDRVIKGYFPSEVKNMLLDSNLIYYEDKQNFRNFVKMILIMIMMELYLYLLSNRHFYKKVV